MSIKEMRVACIGAGMMGGALMRAVAKVVGGGNLTVSEPNAAKADEFAKENGINKLKVHLGGKEYFESRAFYPKHGFEEVEENYMEKRI